MSEVSWLMTLPFLFSILYSVEDKKVCQNMFLWLIGVKKQNQIDKIF